MMKGTFSAEPETGRFFMPFRMSDRTELRTEEAMEKWNNVQLKSVFNDSDVACYRLFGDSFLNEYYVVSHPDSSRLMNSPEIVGYEVYNCTLPSTQRMLRYFKENNRISSANILSILRGALNYPLEESCYKENILVHDISFLSSERVFHNDEIAGLEIKYSKLAMVPDSTLLIGDILATGDTFRNCLKYVIDYYRKHNRKLRNIILFTIGGTAGIDLMERLTKDLRVEWPEFEGFIGIYYEGIFRTYQEKGCTGIQLPNVDFYWGGGVISPEFRMRTLSTTDPLFEKCIIYDGGARRYEIMDHIQEVSEYWENMLERADLIDLITLVEERLGYQIPISFEDWCIKNHYQALNELEMLACYQQEQNFLSSLKNSGVSIRAIAEKRLREFTEALHPYILD